MHQLKLTRDWDRLLWGNWDQFKEALAKTRIIKFIQVGEPDDCWPWLGYQKGYGVLSWKGKWMQAHRVLWSIAFGPIEDGLIIRHLCHTRLCVNPRHLEEGTHMENAHD